MSKLLEWGDGGDGEGEVPGYAEYMFTDVSAGYFPQARERFKGAPNMRFQAFDITRDALQQGFVAGSYDLVVAPNVVHATPCLRETLANLRPLLKDDGMLLLVELSTVMRMPTFIFGNFSGWWLGEEDGRVWEPYVLPERWDEELKAAGFTGVDALVADGEMPWQMGVVMVSRPKVEEKTEPDRKVTLLCQDPADGPVQSLVAGLESEGWDVLPCRLGELPPTGRDIISCIDLETRFFDQGYLTEANFTAFQGLLRHLQDKDSRILWLTPPFQVKCRDPRGAQALGVMRTIRAELGLSLFTLELDYEREAQHAVHLISKVFVKKVQNSQDGDILNADREFAIDNGTILLSRYHPFSITREQTLPPDNTTASTPTPITTVSPCHSIPPTATTLRIPHPGHLPSLTWTTTALLSPSHLPPTHVLIRIHSAALNFRDILLATGTIPAPLHTPTPLGYEASGTILHTGTGPAAATRFRPGDRVLLLSPHSTLTTTLCVPAALVVRIPDAMPLGAAAAAPVCFGTVMHALLEVGRLRQGMSVLVHSACGGVGLAALEVCRMVGGVEVFVTVGSEEKVEWLVGGDWGVRRERVFGSRDGGFVEGVMRETQGRGVDLVLNSLSGELLHASWGCVAKYGMLLELGKRDLAGAGRLDMAPFLANRTYAGVDLLQYVAERPEKVTELLTQYVDMYEQGRLRLPHPVSYFQAGDVEQAFRHLQNAGHIGKVVVNMPDDASTLNAVPLPRSVTLDPDATYLLVGGAKGLGTSMSSWLVEHGARNLTFLSRGAGTNPESKALFEELRAMGCSVNVVVGSVENKKDILAAVSSSGKVVRGVFQLAMVMNDAPLVDMKWAQWNATIGPKVRGTWNLHDVLADQPLDFFWMASSIVTLVDEAGQSNYSAGCVFLEAFCQYRHSLGLPATVLNISPIGGVGYVAENAHARRSIKAQGLYTLGEHEFLDFVAHNILAAGSRSNIEVGVKPSSLPGASVLQSWENPNQVVMGLRSASDLPLDDPNSRTNWRRDRRMGRYHNIRPDEEHKASSSGESRMALFLDNIISSDGESVKNRLADPEVVAFLAREIGGKIYEFILKPITGDEEVDTRLTLAQIGLDSLMAIELRRWLRRVFGIVISVLEIMGSGSLIQVGEVVAGKLAEKLTKE
ncbi:hypothetical protein CHGG_00088 [Chaetomium globosum CBS 148.51]|uniref:Carrier domain-containing protein n=1 Tax=Chaetomium globosum (strain ATCC 6205 / CBS 148.51 / DSM 1962 / NBRC 6347 / NRRL 1970) TaxID=306901 RepID=Q2HI66_CHAGB|nr:uncharacterized protein CHGG_00088 [Chaetomium globosum CBS 148.51]EAQ91853.1 hypothetical protein CHGG_00088 [Chaetomium globosum CBS 148.51]